MIQTAESPILKLRQDLQITSRETPEGKAFVVKDPVAGRFFQFGEIEHTILRRFDGRAPLEQIRSEVSKELDCELDAETLNGFVARLKQMRLLDTGEAQAPSPPPRKFVRGSILYLRLAAFDPDQFLTRITPRLGFFFTPEFVFISALVILAAAAITVGKWSEICYGLRFLTHFQWLFLAWLTLFCVTTLHEFGHGVTCKHFGGSVHELGFLLIFFEPAFYCNVSDAWMFPEKSKRLWVMFAGGYFEIFIWGLATLAWRATEPGTWVSTLALLIMATSGVKVLFNYNPLIKLDGYYLLSDYLEAPNLRQRSFAYLRGCLRRGLGLSADDAAPPSPRERRIYLAYGLLAAAYSYWLLSIIALQFGKYLIARYHALGLAIFLTILGALFREPLKKVLARPFALLGLVLQRFTTGNKLVKIPALLGVILAILYLVRVPLRVGGEFQVQPERHADVRAEVEGVVEKIDVAEGQWVNRGDLLAELSVRDYRNALEQVSDQITKSQAELKKLKTGATPQEIHLQKDEVATADARVQHAHDRYQQAVQMHAAQLARANASRMKAEERLVYARKDLERYQELFGEGLTSKKQLDEAQEKVAVGEKELAESRAELELVNSDRLAEVRQEMGVAEKQYGVAQAQLDKLLAGTRPEEIAAAQAELARLNTEQRYLEGQIRLCSVVSPVSGRIATHRPKELIGSYLKKGDLIVKVDETERVSVEIPVSEKEVADVAVGQPVIFKARAYPDRVFHGSVTAIAPVVTQDPTDPERHVLVMTEIANASNLLAPAMTGLAKIDCGERRMASLISRKFRQFFRVEFWSWW